MTVYDVGDRARLYLALTDVTGAAANGTVSVTVTSPSGVTPSLTPTNTATGAYYVDVDLDEAGTWVFRWVSTGAVIAAQDGTLVVESNLSRSLYCTVAELKGQMSVSDTVDDALLEQAIRGTSRAIDEMCDRRFYADSAATARTFRTADPYLLDVDDISSLTGLVVKVDTGDTGSYDQTLTVATDYIAEPSNALAQGLPVEGILHVSGVWPTCGRRPRVQVTAKWGWPVVPEQVRSACLVKSARLFRRKDSPEGIAGVNDFGSVRISRFEDPDVVLLLQPFMPGPMVG